jgi:hypothetical protein
MSDVEPGRLEPERADLDVIERDLREVESTLARLADGTYWTEHPDAPIPPASPD